MKFSYVNPTLIHFGQGQIEAIATSIPQDQKVLVIYGGGSIKHNGVYDQVVAALSNHTWLEFSGVEPNPTVETLDKAVTIAKEENVDYILAVGGGSVIDGSKYVAAATKYDGNGWDILIGKHTVTEAVPLGAILTLHDDCIVITKRRHSDTNICQCIFCAYGFTMLSYHTDHVHS